MATQHSRSAARIMMAPAVILLLGWMLVPLAFAFMAGWWFKFGVLADIGVYVVVVVLLGFGLIGSYTYGRARH